MERGCLDHKNLKIDHGFLIHMSRTHRQMCPQFKGLHLTLNLQRRNRDEERCKKTIRMIILCDSAMNEGNEGEIDPDAPKNVFPVSKQMNDVLALEFLLEGQNRKRLKYIYQRQANLVMELVIPLEKVMEQRLMWMKISTIGIVNDCLKQGNNHLTIES